MGNTTTTNNKKKKSNARKIIPAIGMLMTSAAMLTTSTYAWFTMNKEVSITGISLTATVPETLEISLGSMTSKPTQDTDTHAIIVSTPSNDDNGKDWSNSVDIAGYYIGANNPNNINFGKLVPVSSINGYQMFYTSDAIGDGTELKENAVFVEKTSGLIENGADKSGPNRYYLDIPVWFRSTAHSATAEDIKLSVKATIQPTNNENPELYKAARVSILKVNRTGNVDTIDSSPNGGVIMDTLAKYNSEKDETSSVKAVSSARTMNDTSAVSEHYGVVDPVVQTGTEGKTAESVVSVPKRLETGGTYETENQRHGDMVERIVRIWLEGEDQACFNPNAGQSFSISLEFADMATSNSLATN